MAKETREGDVFHRLLQKLEVESQALKGRVFDILGEVFEDTSLKDLLLQAIRYGDQPEVRARLGKKIENALDHDHLKDILDRNALANETLGPERLFAVKEEMEKAEARRLQPYFIRSFFMKAFDSLGGSIYSRELERFEISHVPAVLRERDRLITGRNRRELAPVLKRYERVCFAKDAVRPVEKPGLPFAIMIHPGHPLMLAMTDVVLESHANLLRQGAILVDPTDHGDQPSLLFLLTHEVKSGDNRPDGGRVAGARDGAGATGKVISKRLQFVHVLPDGSASFAGWAPHLDLEALAATDRPLLDELLTQPWLTAGLEQRALALAAATLVPEHFDEIAVRRIALVDKTLAAVHERLTKEIDFWSDRYIKLTEDQAAGKDVRLNLENVRRTLTDLEARLEGRKKELQSMRHVTSSTPVALSGALVIPAGLIRKLRGEPAPDATAALFSVDPAARSRIEQMAMNAVRTAEEARGCKVVDVSAQKCGWDLTSYPPPEGNKQPQARHIEVKGRAKGQTTITVSRNEVLYGLNQADKFILAIVVVDGEQTEGPYYVREPFSQEPDWAVSSINLDLGELLQKAGKG